MEGGISEGFSLAALIVSAILSGFTIFTNVRISQINNIKDLHTYNRRITRFELQFKDELGLADLLESGEFAKYSLKSQKKIWKWGADYQKKHIAVLLHPQVDYTKLKMSPAEFMKLKNKSAETKDIDDDKSDGSTDW